MTLQELASHAVDAALRDKSVIEFELDTSALRAQEAGALVREVVQQSAAVGLPLKVIHVDGMFAHTIGGDPVIAAGAEVLGSQTVGGVPVITVIDLNDKFVVRVAR